jgi:hypothetical protein
MSLLAYTEFANAICHKAQKAAQAMIQARITANGIEAEIPTGRVFAGIGNGDLTAIRVVAICQSAVPNLHWEGNWDADLSIVVVAPASDISEDDFHSLCGQVFAFFFQAPADVLSRLSNADIKFTATFIIPTGCGWDIESDGEGNGANWVSEQKFKVTCCGSVIA